MYCLTFYVLYQPFIIFKLTLYRQPGNLLFVSHCPLNAPGEFTFPLNMMLFLVLLPSSGHFRIQQVDQNKELGERQQNLLQKRTCQHVSTDKLIIYIFIIPLNRD